MNRVVVVAAVVLGCGLYACSDNRQDMAKDNSAVNKRSLALTYEAFDKGDTAALNSLIADDVIDHQIDTSMTKMRGLAAVKEMFVMYHQAIPDMHTTVHVLATAGDTVIGMTTSVGTQTGPMMGMPATNKPISMTGVDVIRVKDGKAVEHWGFLDPNEMMAMMKSSEPPQKPEMNKEMKHK